MAQDSRGEIRTLSRDLSRLRRRAARQKRNIKNGADGWQQWSVTIQEIAAVTQRLVSSPASDVADLSAKFHAILSLIEVNESMLDTCDLRRLRRFRRELDLLARGVM